MVPIAKRLLNILSIICTLYLLTLIFTMVTGSVANWSQFIGINFGLLAVGYTIIAAINYIVFGEVRLWHKKPSQ
ncbi:MAG: hypothetical protein C4516_03020 [Oxalobacter sp.]|nr:MAG: hypothetical protein C4516_03020 [Oxalobacter sp.]